MKELHHNKKKKKKSITQENIITEEQNHKLASIFALPHNKNNSPLLNQLVFQSSRKDLA